jgi:hypothetical protein
LATKRFIPITRWKRKIRKYKDKTVRVISKADDVVYSIDERIDKFIKS